MDRLLRLIGTAADHPRLSRFCQQLVAMRDPTRRQRHDRHPTLDVHGEEGNLAKAVLAE
jgi:hypothetical protein